MKIKIFSILVILISLAISSYSQASYPNIIIKGTDTSCVVPIDAIRTYNAAISDLDACNEVADSLNAQKERYKSISETKSVVISDDNVLIDNYKKQVAEKEITEASYKKEADQHKNKITWLKIQRNVLLIPAAIGTGTIIYEAKKLFP